MNCESRFARVTVTVLIVAAALVYPTTSAAQGVVPYGPLYDYLAGKWWQYSIGIPGNYGGTTPGNPPPTNNQPDATGQFCHVAQSGDRQDHKLDMTVDLPVFYLSGGGVNLVRSCTVPHNRMLFFPIINSECSTLELDPWYCADEDSCRACTTKYQSKQNANCDGKAQDIVSAEIDGVPVANVEDYYAVSGLYDIRIPAANILYSPFGPGTKGKSVASGYWLLLNPLPPGEHTIHFKAKTADCADFPGSEQEVTYNLTVK